MQMPPEVVRLDCLLSAWCEVLDPVPDCAWGNQVSSKPINKFAVADVSVAISVARRHELLNFVFLDGDVELIQREPNLVLGKRARPICINLLECLS